MKYFMQYCLFVQDFFLKGGKTYQKLWKLCKVAKDTMHQQLNVAEADDCQAPMQIYVY